MKLEVGNRIVHELNNRKEYFEVTYVDLKRSLVVAFNSGRFSVQFDLEQQDPDNLEQVSVFKVEGRFKLIR